MEGSVYPYGKGSRVWGLGELSGKRVGFLGCFIGSLGGVEREREKEKEMAGEKQSREGGVGELEKVATLPSGCFLC